MTDCQNFTMERQRLLTIPYYNGVKTTFFTSIPEINFLTIVSKTRR